MKPFVILFTPEGSDVLQIQAMIAESEEDSILGFCEGKSQEELESTIINAVLDQEALGIVVESMDLAAFEAQKHMAQEQPQ